MTDNKKAKANQPNSKLILQVMSDLTVQIIPNQNYEFLMTTKEVALGYGVSEYNIRRHKHEHIDELLDSKHFLNNVSIPHAAQRGASNGTMWTKRGVVRLGFFIKSQRAKLFRDWAEDLVIDKLNAQTALFDVAPSPQKKLKPKGNYNRLTPARLIDLLQDVCLIEDKALRIKISAKLKGGYNE